MGHKVTNDKNYLSELEGFLNRRGKLKIMLEGEIDTESNICILINKYSELIELKSDKGQVFNYSDSETGNIIPVHFTTADGRMYRVENDINGHKARGSFNGESDAQRLEQLFDRVFCAN